MKRLSLVLLSLLTLICGCKTEKQKDFTWREFAQSEFKYVVSMEAAQVVTEFADLADGVRYIKLESKPESLIGEIDRIEIVNDNLLIFDEKNSLLLLFDINGKYLRKIGVQGQGPGQYTKIRTFAIDRENNNDILIVDAVRQTLLRYDFNGRHISSKKIEVYTDFFMCFNGNLVFYKNKDPYFNGAENYHDILVVKNQEIVSELFPFQKEYQSWYTPDRVFYVFNDTLNFLDYWEGKVYSLVNNKPVPRITLDFKGELIPKEYTRSKEEFDRHRKQFSYWYSTFVETENYLWYDYLKTGQLWHVCFSKNSNVSKTKGSQNKDFELGALHPICSYKNDTVVAFIEPVILLKVRDRGVIKNSKLLEVARNLKDGDNPVISFIHLKMD